MENIIGAFITDEEGGYIYIQRWLKLCNAEDVSYGFH